MDIRTLLDTHTLVLAKDLGKVAILANKNPEHVIVRDIYAQRINTLADYAVSPFVFGSQDGEPVLLGIDAETELPAKIKIIDNDGTVALMDPNHNEWFKPSLGSVRLYIPISA